MLEILIAKPSVADFARETVRSLARQDADIARLVDSKEETAFVSPGILLDHLHPEAAGDPASLCSAGVVSCTLAATADSLGEVAGVVRRALDHPLARTGLFAGVFLVGPFVKGGETGGNAASARRIVQAADGTLRAVAFAPERVEVGTFVPEIVRAGVRALVAHTDASYELCAEAFSLGAEGVSLPFVSTAPVHHREAGPIAAAAKAGARAELPIGHRGLTGQQTRFLAAAFGERLRPIFHPATEGCRGVRGRVPSDFAGLVSREAHIKARTALAACRADEREGTFVLLDERLRVLAVAADGRLVLGADKAEQ